MTSFQLTANSSNSAAAEFWSSWVPLWAPLLAISSLPGVRHSHSLSFHFSPPLRPCPPPSLSLMPRVPPTGGCMRDAGEGAAAAAPAQHPPAADSGEGCGFPREGARQRLPQNGIHREGTWQRQFPARRPPQQPLPLRGSAPPAAAPLQPLCQQR